MFQVNKIHDVILVSVLLNMNKFTLSNYSFLILLEQVLVPERANFLTLETYSDYIWDNNDSVYFVWKVKNRIYLAYLHNYLMGTYKELKYHSKNTTVILSK